MTPGTVLGDANALLAMLGLGVGIIAIMISDVALHVWHKLTDDD